MAFRWSSGARILGGSGGWRDATGIFVITRSSGGSPTHYIVVPNSGATKISQAPIGPGVITSAQRHGTLDFTSNWGVSGTVNLEDDTVTLSGGEVIHATETPLLRATLMGARRCPRRYSPPAMGTLSVSVPEYNRHLLNPLR